MNTFTNRPIHFQADGVCFDNSFFRIDFGIGQMIARGIKTQLAGIDRFPGLAVNVETIIADEACINSIDTFIAGCPDLASLISDHECTPLADGNSWWRYLNFYWHASSPC